MDSVFDAISELLSVLLDYTYKHGELFILIRQYLTALDNDITRASDIDSRATDRYIAVTLHYYFG
jgi:hypothetical protein